MSVKSMTGYGRANAMLDGSNINVEIRSVNHRYFDFSARMPKDFMFMEDKLKAAVNAAVSRGKVELFLYIENAASDSVPEINEPLASRYCAAFNRLAKSLKIKNDISVSFLSRLPDVMTLKVHKFDEKQLSDTVLDLVSRALESYDAMRAAEGEKLQEDVLKNLDALLEITTDVEKLTPESVEAYKNRLRAKMLEALEGKEYDEQRLITEVALFADRVDVGEETVRLKSHISQFRSLMNGNGEPVGKKLDFIVQEMNRETNTIGSKCSQVEITRMVVEAKSVIEKIREQIQNIE